MARCWHYYPKYRCTFGQILESLQGDVKKSFFSVSWYYTSKADSTESECESMHNDTDESQPLVAGSYASSSQDVASAASQLSPFTKDLVVDVGDSIIPYSESDYPTPKGSEPEERGLINGHLPSDETDSLTDSGDNISCKDCVTQAANSVTGGIARGRPNNSVTPPSYTSAIGRIPPRDWSADSSKSNSCNGSANGHVSYTHLTTACWL